MKRKTSKILGFLLTVFMAAGLLSPNARAGYFVSSTSEQTLAESSELQNIGVAFANVNDEEGPKPNRVGLAVKYTDLKSDGNSITIAISGHHSALGTIDFIGSTGFPASNVWTYIYRADAETPSCPLDMSVQIDEDELKAAPSGVYTATVTYRFLIDGDLDNIIEQDETLTLTKTSAPYIITFNGNEGTPAKQSLETGDDGKLQPHQFLELEEFVREGYTLKGWDESAAATTPTYIGMPEGPFTKNMTFYAIWEKEITKYPVWIGKTQVTSENKDDVLEDGGSVKYTPATESDAAKLVLNDPSISDAYTDAEGLESVIYAAEALDIEGKATLSGADCGIRATVGRLKIINAELNVSGTLYGIYSDKYLAIEGGSVTVDATDYAVSTAIFSENTVFLESGGSVTAIGGTAIASSKDVYISYSAGKLTATGKQARNRTFSTFTQPAAEPAPSA